jgi:hypothetical protein
MEHLRGNYFELIFGPACDRSGALITTLGSAVRVIFVIKTSQTDDDDDALAIATLGDGITVNGTTGIITIKINSDDMDDIPPGQYYIGLQVEFSATNRIECVLTENNREIDTIDILQDIVVGGA